MKGQSFQDSDNREHLENAPARVNKDDNPDVHYKVDKRYRESDYFLEDQLRYAEAVQEFRSIREALTNAAAFDLGKLAFRFIRADQ